MEEALDGTFALEDVEREVAEGRAQFWPLGSAAVVTQVAQYPRKRVLRVWLAGGSLDTLRRAGPALDEIARECGCSRIEIEGRKGWGRVLDGYTEQRVVLTKEL